MTNKVIEHIELRYLLTGMQLCPLILFELNMFFTFIEYMMARKTLSAYTNNKLFLEGKQKNDVMSEKHKNMCTVLNYYDHFLFLLLLSVVMFHFPFLLC